MTAPSTAVAMCNIALSYVGWTEAITSLTADANKADRQCNLHYSATLQEMLELFAWNSTMDHRPLVLTSGFKAYHDKFGTTAPTISGITQANPAVVTASSHGFSTGQYVEIYDVTGMTEVNGNIYYITKVTDDTFQLTGINSTNFTAYSSGGSCRRKQPQVKYEDAFTYDIPSNLIMAIGLEYSGSTYEIIDQAGSRELITNTEDAILSYVRAMSSDATVSQFSQLFLDAFAHSLAIKLAVPMKGGSGGLKLKMELKESFKDILSRAQIAEARAVNIVADDENIYVTSRDNYLGESRQRMLRDLK